MQAFLQNNRADLIARCKAKVALRPQRLPSNRQLEDGIPLFLDQLTRTLLAESRGQRSEGLRISGASGGDVKMPSEVGVAAKAHGRHLLELGYSIDQVVHDYGDLCQAITDLAVERDAPFSLDAFRTLNRCLDNAIADAVAEFSSQSDAASAGKHAADESQRVTCVLHELQSHLHVCTLAFDAISLGRLSVGGATGDTLKRGLHRLKVLMDETLAEIRDVSAPGSARHFSLSSFIADAAAVASVYADDTGCKLWVPLVDPLLGIRGNRELLSAALNNVLQNAFKFSEPESEVTLSAFSTGDRILIEVRDHCGGLPQGAVENLFRPSGPGKNDHRGLGLGLALAAQSVAANGGTLSARNVPGTGCVFVIDLAAEPLRAGASH